MRVTTTLAISAIVLMAATSAQALPGEPTTSHGFTVRITAGQQACTGALIDPLWVLTSSSCLQGEVKVNGAATAKVVRHADRDAALVKLAAASTATPIAVSTTAPIVGETLKATGFGRTAAEWVPDRASVASFTVSSVSPADVALTGDKDTCKGDSGGPAFREAGGTPQLVGLHRTSWQHGCLAVTETRKGSTETRVDTLRSWLDAERFELAATAAPRHAINLTWAARGFTSFRVYAAESATGPFTSVGTVSTPSFTHGLLAANKTWYYRVAGVLNGQETVSVTVSDTTKVPLRSDFNGDGFDDVAAAYDMGNARTTLPVWRGGPNGLGVPEVELDSGEGAFAADRARWVTGDFNGDGKADGAAFYNYGSTGAVSMWVAYANATGFDPLVEKWSGGAGNWPGQGSKIVAGDFNADGRADIAAFYDTGNYQTKLFAWYGTATGFETPVEKWASGENQWDQARATFLGGDYTGDGRADVAAVYRYEGDSIALFVFEATANGFKAPVRKLDVTGWANANARYISGDFNGDGRTDIGAFYNYANGLTNLHVFYGNAAGFDGWTTKWTGGEQNWPAQSARLVAGDYTGDGLADVVAFYNLENGVTRAFLWKGTATGFDAPVQQWDGGAGNGPAQGAKLL